jgi:hypothetical protein
MEAKALSGNLNGARQVELAGEIHSKPVRQSTLFQKQRRTLA